MTESDATKERLSEYERAICYDTLPSVTHPLSYRLVVAYFVLLLAAFLLMAYGIRTDHAVWRTWGVVVFGAVVVAGVLGFLVRAILNQMHEREALAAAETVPNVESGFDGLPDPFENHVLLRYYRFQEGNERSITDNRGRPVYSVVHSRGGTQWEVREPTGSVLMTIDAIRGERSFSFGVGTASQYVVMREDTKTASLHRPFSFGSAAVEIRCGEAGADRYTFREGGIFKGQELVGRIYFIRNYAYLDLRRSSLNDGTLAFFIAMI